jgi:dimethylaniline monooxygenase (N-oxide forming)
LKPDLRPMEGHRVKLYLRVAHPTQSDLYFIGLFNVAGGGNIRMMDDQAEWLTELICGEQRLPDIAQMNRVMDEEQEYLAKNFPGSTRYALELDPMFYRKQLAKQRSMGQVLTSNKVAA